MNLWVVFTPIWRGHGLGPKLWGTSDLNAHKRVGLVEENLGGSSLALGLGSYH